MFKKAIWALPLMLFLAAGLLSLGGCFLTPTNPHAASFTSGGHQDGGIYATPTPDIDPNPNPTPGTGGGTINGTVTGFGTEAVEIVATAAGSLIGTANRTGDGAYTVTGLADGDYYVTARSTSHFGQYGGSTVILVTISGGNTRNGINIAALY
jgi:hypothetical protein